MAIEVVFRPAAREDIPRLEELIERSVNELQKDHYSAEQRQSALGVLLGIDTMLIDDGTYYACELSRLEGPTLVACGGWSKRGTLFGADHAHGRQEKLLNPGRDAAKIRAIFVHPDWARKGIGGRMLMHCENAARQAGFRSFEMGSTLTGVPLYLLHGYVETERVEVPLPNGATLPVVRMRKDEALSIK